MNLKTLTLGERMVMAARIAAAEHIRQAAKASGVDVAQVQRLLSNASGTAGTFNTVHPIKLDPKEAA